tara:strand:- start:5402 stop:6478 length:1077 start_codon:yes stop_codon:yes gene_type:complete
VIQLIPRENVSPVLSLLGPLFSIGFTMLIGGILFYFLGVDPFAAIKMIFWDPLMSETFSTYSIPQIFIKGAPLILIALGLSVGFKANIWNIGAEGQYIMGAIFGASFALSLYPLESAFIFPLMVFIGIAGGCLWSLIPAILKIRFNVNEILVSLMLVYVAEQILALASLGFLRNPDGAGFPGSRNLSQYPSASNSELILGTGIHLGVVLSLFMIVFFYILFFRHSLGFKIKLLGSSPKAYSFSGQNPNKLIFICLTLSGGLAGLAGIMEVAGPAGQINIDFNVGYGFTAIIVAFLGRLNPIGILFAGLVMALTYVGGELTQFMLNLPAAAIQLFQGMLLFFLLSFDLFVYYKIRLRGN